MRIKCLLAIFVLFSFWSCRNELELNAPYREIPVIYAVLNPQEPLQMIRINKIFLGEGDANVMAKSADSVNYPAGELSVSLQHSSGRSWHFRDSVITTSPGDFSTTQRVYVLGGTVAERLDSTGAYKLVVRNNRSGNVFTASAQALDNVPLTARPPFTAPYYPVDRKLYNPNDPATAAYYIDYSIQNQNYNVRYSVNNARIYNLVMRFHFIDSIETVGNIPRHVDYAFSNQYLKDAPTSGPNSNLLSGTFRGSDLFAGLGISLARMALPGNIYGRRLVKVQYLVTASTQDYLDFLEYAKPSLSITTQKPVYSNFDGKNAFGIFTFRSTLSIMKEPNFSFINAFADNASTCSFKFMKADLTVPGCR